jgi:hypothetical protein
MKTRITAGAPGKPIRAPRPPRPPVIPKPKPRAVYDTRRARAEAELDARIAALHPATARAEAYLRALGIDPAAAACAPAALALWNGGAREIPKIPRRWFL